MNPRTRAIVTTLIGALWLLCGNYPGAAAQAEAENHTPLFRPSALTTFRDSFALVVQGQVQGWHVYGVERTADGFRYIDRFALGSAMSRDVEVVLGTRLQCIRSRYEGVEFGKGVMADVQYGGGRAVGVGLRRTDTGPVRAAIDTALSGEAFDGLALMALILTLEWRVGAVYPLTVFDVDEGGSVTTQTLRVSTQEDVAVPAGRFRAYRADLTTTQAPVRIWVTASAPHRLLKVGGADESFATVLVAASP